MKSRQMICRISQQNWLPHCPLGAEDVNDFHWRISSPVKTTTTTKTFNSQNHYNIQSDKSEYRLALSPWTEEVQALHALTIGAISLGKKQAGLQFSKRVSSWSGAYFGRWRSKTTLWPSSNKAKNGHLGFLPAVMPRSQSSVDCWVEISTVTPMAISGVCSSELSTTTTTTATYTKDLSSTTCLQILNSRSTSS